jgi:hypothetical protein
VAASAVTDALKRVWAVLEPLNLPMALMGGLAVALWKHPRNTRDVDILVDVRDGNLDKLVEAMKRAGMRSKRQPPVLLARVPCRDGRRPDQGQSRLRLVAIGQQSRHGSPGVDHHAS